MNRIPIAGCTRPYLFHEVGVTIMAHPKSCFFCDHCTDIWYDLGEGPYMFECLKQGDGEENDVCIIRGLKGCCPNFVEDGDEQIERSSPFSELSIIDTKEYVWRK